MQNKFNVLKHYTREQVVQLSVNLENYLNDFFDYFEMTHLIEPSAASVHIETNKVVFSIRWGGSILSSYKVHPSVAFNETIDWEDINYDIKKIY